MKAILAGLLAFICSAASASMDNPMVAAREAEGAVSIPGPSLLFGAIGAAWLGWAGREDGKVIIGAFVGWAIGSMVGLFVAMALR